MHQAAYVLAVAALLSQILGLIRDRLLASTFGAGVDLDTYYAAFRLQEVVFTGVVSLVSLSALLPVLAERLDKDAAAAARLLNTVFSALIVGVVAVSIVLWLWAPIILPHIFTGLFPGGHNDALITLSRILLLSPLLLGISSLFTALAQIHRRFILTAVSPLLYNAGIIVGIVLFYPLLGLAGLAWGVIFGALLHMLIQVPFVQSVRLLPRFSFDWQAKDLARLIGISLPRAVGLFLNTAVFLLLIGIASHTGEGGVTVLSFSFNLQSVFVAMIGASYSVAAFPVLAAHFSRGEHEYFQRYATGAARHILFWSIPVSVLFWVLSLPIVDVILGVGAYSEQAVAATAAVAATFALSLAAQNISLLLMRAMYAGGKTLVPVLSAVAATAITVCLTLLFVFLPLGTSIRLLTYVGYGGPLVLLAAAFSLGALLQALLLVWFAASRRLIQARELLAPCVHGLIAALAGGLVAWLALVFLQNFVMHTGVWITLGEGLFAGLLGIGVWATALHIFGSREFQEVFSSVCARFALLRPLSIEQ